MDKDWLFATEEYICELRTVGVLIRDNKILVQRDRDGNEFALPGGHVKIGETLENGLIREFKEETGADILCKRILWSEECFWEWKGKQAHTIAFYYLIELCEGSVFLIMMNLYHTKITAMWFLVGCRLMKFRMSLSILSSSKKKFII